MGNELGTSIERAAGVLSNCLDRGIISLTRALILGSIVLMLGNVALVASILTLTLR